MEEKSYLKDAFTAHLAGNEKAAVAKLNEGLNYYSGLISSAYNGQNKGDLLLIAVALKCHYEIILNQCGDIESELVKILADRVSVTCIHN